jgi:putative two-component system response regulator
MRKTVLVVDDEPANRALLEAILEEHSYNVATAANGKEALSRFISVKPDIVLTDANMPELDGFEVCRHLKGNSDSCLTPVVLVTGLADSASRIRGINAGADDFLNKPIDQSELLARVDALLKVKDYTDELDKVETVILTLARAIEARDPYTEGHCERLSDYGSMIAERMKLSDEEVTALRRAGTLHDIGKIAVPDSILLKNGPMTSEERFIMQQHSEIGERICAPIKAFRLVTPIIRHHHERLDGSGYPDGLEGDEIPLTVRIMSMVDVFDSLTTERTYRKTLTDADALEIIAEEVKRGWWDEKIFSELREMVHDVRG